MITFRPSSVRPLTFSNDFSEAAEPILLKFHMDLFRLGESKVAKMVAIRWPRWPSCPYMVKKLFFTRTEDALGLYLCTNHLGREFYQNC